MLRDGQSDHRPEQVPYLTMDGPEDTNARLGSNTTLRCRLQWKNMLGQRWTSATPRVDIQWIKDGFGFSREVLETSFGSRYRLDVKQSAGVYDLQIQSLQKDDEGDYACQAQILSDHRDPQAQSLVYGNRQPVMTARGGGQRAMNDLMTVAELRTATMPMSFVRSKEVKLRLFGLLNSAFTRLC
ncbi:unnamed protein product [Schistocephalus solidus]|uniref:Ig-like domain-containing protein n=1 Tax=Schistocephalus solidus TaxID=70667 RepID=A0A183TC15_SCHSO|nr:unnamed protein product [Schistocephalus solidus]